MSVPDYHLINAGDKFWRWTVLGPARRRSFRLRCDCGVEKVLGWRQLERGRDKSCGCLRQEVQPGGTMTPTRRSWSSMRSRCSSQSTRSNYVKYYKAYGVTVCDRWQGEEGFANFLADMGPRPPGKTLDRFPDPFGNYEPSNCRWATPREQTHNKRNNIAIEYEGTRYPCLIDACTAAGVNHRELYGFIYRLHLDPQYVFDLLVVGLRPPRRKIGRQRKLTAKQVENIRADPRLYREIVADYNVSTATISLIKKRRAMRQAAAAQYLANLKLDLKT